MKIPIYWQVHCGPCIFNMDTSTSTTNMETGMVLQLLFNFGSAALPLKNDDKSTTSLARCIHLQSSPGSIEIDLWDPFFTSRIIMIMGGRVNIPWPSMTYTLNSPWSVPSPMSAFGVVVAWHPRRCARHLCHPERGSNDATS